MKQTIFIPITKVDAVQRIVYGVAAVEEVDKAGEIFDYETSKPLFEAWSADAQKFSQGKSYGNVRAMHGKVAAGRLDQLAFDDDAKRIEVAAKIVDDNEWQKVEEGVYTGFSIGGKYEKRWKDGENTRYTAAPSEVSIVDNPCQPSARFTMTKADGSTEERPFVSVMQEDAGMATNDQVAARARELAKTAGDETKWATFVEKARAELDPPSDEAPDPGAEAAAKAAEAEVPAAAQAEEPAVEVAEPAAEADPASVEAEAAKAAGSPANPEDGLAQVWQAKDGKTFSKKAEAVAHNEELAKAEGAEPDLSSALAELTGQVEKAEQARSPEADTEQVEKFENVEGDEPTYFHKKDYSTDKRKEMASSGEAMSDGSYPIATKADLQNAVQAYGRAKDKVATKKHIITRAKALGATDVLPEGWDGSTKGAKKYDDTQVDALRKALGIGSGRPADADALQKGLGQVSRLACLVQELAWLQCDVKWEADAEGDGSSLPQELKEDLANLLNTLKNLLTEESQELFTGEEMDVYGEMLEAAHAPKGLDALVKVLGEDAPGALAKVGARHSKGDLAKVQAMHDTSVDLGASCGASEKAAPVGDLAKVTAERDDLQKQVTEALPVIRDLADRLKKIEDQPMPRPGDGTLRVVDKAADDARAAGDVLTELAKSNPDALATAMIRLSQQHPQKMQPGR